MTIGNKYNVIGISSGTSMDGLDCSYINTDGKDFVSIIYENSYKFSANYRTKLKKIIRFLNNNKNINYNKYKCDHELFVTNKYISLIKKFIRENNIKRLEKIDKINMLIAKHEEKMANRFLEFIESEKKIKLFGKRKVENKNRAPTFSFTIEDISSAKVSEALVSQDIALRNDNFYAWRCLQALGIDTEDGVVRASMVHYNNSEDVEKLINALKTVIR